LCSGVALFALAGALDFGLVSGLVARPYDVRYVPDGTYARTAALGHRTFLSDLYWLSAVQYIGDPKADQRGWEKLYPLVDLVTDLDPRHGYAFQTAGIVLSAAGRLDESDRMLIKGIEKGPNWWSYGFYVAFNYWFYRGDYATAAFWAARAAKAPDASTHVSQMALALASKSHRPEDVLPVLQELRGLAKDETTVATLDEQIKQAVLERDAQALESLVSAHEQNVGHPLSSLDELISAGYLAALPPDPFGGKYVWNSAERRVHSSVNDFRFKPQGETHQPHFQYQPDEALP
jgi:hypothetical protein